MERRTPNKQGSKERLQNISHTYIEDKTDLSTNEGCKKEKKGSQWITLLYPCR